MRARNFKYLREQKKIEVNKEALREDEGAAPAGSPLLQSESRIVPIPPSPLPATVV